METHVHHKIAAAWFPQRGETICAFCRVTQMAFLRLLTNRSVMKADAATPAQAWRIYHAMLASSEAVWLPEPESFEARWEKFAQRSGGAGSEWTDAYLAAFAIGHGSRFVTFHRDFRRFEPDGLKVLVLETQPSPRP